MSFFHLEVIKKNPRKFKGITPDLIFKKKLLLGQKIEK
jgi:hypothetical protein